MGCGKIKALLHACICEHCFTTEVTTRRSGDGGPRAENTLSWFAPLQRSDRCHICKVDTTHAIADTVEKDTGMRWILVPHVPRIEP